MQALSSGLNTLSNGLQANRNLYVGASVVGVIGGVALYALAHTKGKEPAGYCTTCYQSASHDVNWFQAKDKKNWSSNLAKANFKTKALVFTSSTTVSVITSLAVATLYRSKILSYASNKYVLGSLALTTVIATVAGLVLFSKGKEDDKYIYSDDSDDDIYDLWFEDGN